MIYSRKKPVEGSLSRQAWIRFSRNRAAMAALTWICLSALVATLGYLITPDATPYANQQQLEIAKSRPGFSIQVLLVKKNMVTQPVTLLKKMISGAPDRYNTIPLSSWQIEDETLSYESWSGDEEYPGMPGEVFLWDILYAISSDEEALTIRADSVIVTDLYNIEHRLSLADMQQQITEKHIVKKRFLLGTDRFGRDLLSQLIIGMRISLSVGLIAVIISLLIGLSLGSIAGYYRGWADTIIVWLINVVWSIPTLLLVIAITFAIGKGFWQVFLAVGLTMWVEVARVVRGQIISIREKEFVEAARALGLKDRRIISRHILPNIMGPVIVISAANFASAILIEAGLSFLGIGVQPPTPSWGTMIRDHYGFIILDQGFLAIYPGLLIMLMVLAFMLVGNGLKDALDRTQ